MELTEEQIKKATEIFTYRKAYVDILLKEATVEIAPTEVEDKNEPFSGNQITGNGF